MTGDVVALRELAFVTALAVALDIRVPLIEGLGLALVLLRWVLGAYLGLVEQVLVLV